MISKKMIATIGCTKNERTPIISNPADRLNQNSDSSLLEVIARKRNPAIPNPIKIQKMTYKVSSSRILGNSRAKSPKITPIMPLMRHDNLVSMT